MGVFCGVWGVGCGFDEVLWRKLVSAEIGRRGEVSVKCVSVYGLGGTSRFKFGDGMVGVKEAELALSLG